MRHPRLFIFILLVWLIFLVLLMVYQSSAFAYFLSPWNKRNNGPGFLGSYVCVDAAFYIKNITETFLLVAKATLYSIELTCNLTSLATISGTYVMQDLIKLSGDGFGGFNLSLSAAVI